MKNVEELEKLKKRAAGIEEASRLEIDTLQAQVAAQNNELDLMQAEVTTRVRAKLMYQFMMKQTASWEPRKEID